MKQRNVSVQTRLAAVAAAAACAFAATAETTFVFEGGDYPAKLEWAQRELKGVLDEWAPKVETLLDGSADSARREVVLRLSKAPQIAHTVYPEKRIELNMDWAERTPGEVAGACVHEYAHVVQSSVNAPSWLTEGIADWVRWCNFEGEKGREGAYELAKARPKHDDSYRITAAFLDSLVQIYGRDFIVKLNRACREGTYSEKTWVELTGKSRLRLAAEWKKALVGNAADDVKIVSSSAKADILDWVDPFVGTGGTGHTTPAATCPFGMLQPGPDTGRAEWRYCSGYQYSDREIYRFSQTHLSGTGCYDFSDVGFLPFMGEAAAKRGRDYRTGFDKASERATPGYYAVTLADGVKVEATATPHAAIYRMTFPGAGGKLLFDPSWCQQRVESIISVDISPMAERRVCGRIDRRGWPDHDLFFAWEVSAEPVAAETVETRGRDSVPLTVYTFNQPVVYLKVALSRSSAEGARGNIDAEIPGWDFCGVKSAAAAKWRALVGRVRAKGTEEQLRTFYSAIYHVLFQPNLISDVGEPDEYSTFSCWDTYRAAGPLYTILAPEYVPAFVNSFIRHFDRNGFLPIWTLWGLDNQCMIGAHSIPMLVDAYLKGFGGVDWNKAFACVKSTLTKERRRAKANYDILDKYGYYPCDIVKWESAARLLENCYNDACAARLAKGLGRADDAQFFLDRSHAWTNCYDAATGFIRAKDSAGKWREPFDPFALHVDGTYNRDYCEGNAWHWNWHVMQDPDLLIALHGGKEAATERLVSLFEADPYRGNSGGDGNEIGLVGQYCHGNEPCHHVIYFFTHFGRRDLTAKYAREVAETLYASDFYGLCGNEDCGQMSAWYVFTSMGFYPFDPCGAGYVLGVPMLAEAAIDVGGGKTLRILSGKAGDDASGAVKLNGRVIDGPSVSHGDLMGGGVLEF